MTDIYSRAWTEYSPAIADTDANINTSDKYRTSIPNIPIIVLRYSETKCPEVMEAFLPNYESD
jgi:hypothetical protein